MAVGCICMCLFMQMTIGHACAARDDVDLSLMDRASSLISTPYTATYHDHSLVSFKILYNVHACPPPPQKDFQMRLTI